MTITAQMVKELRESTGAGMMDAKKALVENNGDEAAAIEWLRAHSGRTSDKPWVLMVSLVAPHFPLTAPPATTFRAVR